MITIVLHPPQLAPRSLRVETMTQLQAYLWLGDDVLQRQNCRVLGPSEGSNILAYLSPLCLGQTENKKTLDQTLPPWV